MSPGASPIYGGSLMRGCVHRRGLLDGNSHAGSKQGPLIYKLKVRRLILAKAQRYKQGVEVRDACIITRIELN